MYLLAIETTGAFASVALMQDGRIIGEIHGNDRFSHLQNLMPQVQQLVSDHKLSIHDIDAIAVSNGPGSFTGIRIGVSSARALVQVLEIPCVTVSSLEALAMRAGDFESEEAAGNAESLLICPILDARRGQVYGGGYSLQDGYPVEKIEAGPYTIEEFLAKAAGYDRILLLGDGVDACREKIEKLRPQGTVFASEEIRYQTASKIALLGAKLLAESGGLSCLEVQPNYMRIAEAERKLKEQQAKG